MSVYAVEEWKDIPVFEGRYQVSNLGNIRSLDRYTRSYLSEHKFCKGNTVKQDVNHHGYHRVTLFINGIRNRVAVHRLVAEAFIPNPINLPQINHKDENPHNNAASNLEWCSNSYNVNYGTRTERASSHLRKPVLQLDMEGNVVGRYVSQSEASRQTGILQSCIGRVCSGAAKQSGGYVWRCENNI